MLRKDIENALLKCLQRAYLLRQELKKLHKEDESWHRKRLELKRLLGRGAPFTALLRSRMQDKLSKKLFD